ncbi:DUF2189 domain-containing protein [Altererythrobacter sp.]|uniref:DUF2189 domain-containing protein n=1 Tax=Altererythrobacter sp. TaxID=1872480 RepID=UPI003D09146C
MVTAGQAQVASVTVSTNLAMVDLWKAIVAGGRDFRKQPVFGLFFSGFFIAAGIYLYFALTERGEMAWLIPAAAGFPLLAPFAAAGLYEVSRRIEDGLPMHWPSILLAVRGRGDDQLPFIGVIAFVIFSFWIILAHGIFGIFLGQAGLGSDPLATLMSQDGLLMLLVGSTVGGLVALAFFSLTVVSMPMLIDRDVDFVTAMIVSVRVVQLNKPVMLAWAALVALCLFLAMLPLFLGLFLVLPVLGHATWHLYRRAVH